MLESSGNPLPARVEVVRTLTGVRYWLKWRRTLQQVRRRRNAADDFRQRTRTRLLALGPIRRPVFILGCPRSGTTFLGEVLSALPSATYFFEPQAMKYYSRLVYEKKVTLAQARRVYRWGFRALLLASPGSGPRIIEKNPTHTWIGQELHQIFPDASFVVISRDGRDTALSLLQKPWHRRDALAQFRREPGEYIYGPYPHFYIEADRGEEFTQTSDLRRCIWIWRRFTEEIERLRTVLPSAAQFHLRYEELIRQPETVLTALLAFLGESDGDSRSRVMRAAAAGHESSIGRWKTALTAEDLQTVDHEAGSLLRRLGYV